jgi:hypothetical protein
MPRVPRTVALLTLLASPVAAQQVTPGDLPCVPTGANAAVTARVDPPPSAENSVRLYFRRLNLEVEDFYFVAMKPSGAGNFWGVLPRAESSAIGKKQLKNAASDAWAAWWRAKEASTDRDPNGDLDAGVIRERAAVGKLEKRDWMARRSDADFESWLDQQKLEPTEWYVAVVDPQGRELARSEMRLASVNGDCRTALTDQQQGAADNLVVGHTAAWQNGQKVFHWQCDGVVTRIDPQGVEHADAACRACVVGWWPHAVAGTVGALGVIAIVDEAPRHPEISPSRP